MMIHTQDDFAKAIHHYGILPFFPNRVPGWSVEEMCDPAVYFTNQPGPWEWKGPLASQKICVYGKFIQKKAAFVSPVWFGDLANVRREGYAWDEREEEGLAPHSDTLLMAYLEHHPQVLSKYAKRECGFSKGYDTVLTRLQMQTYIVTCDFRYSMTKAGEPYGWGNAALDLADRWLGEELLRVPRVRTPEASFERIIAHLRKAMPEADEAALRRELK